MATRSELLVVDHFGCSSGRIPALQLWATLSESNTAGGDEIRVGHHVFVNRRRKSGAGHSFNWRRLKPDSQGVGTGTSSRPTSELLTPSPRLKQYARIVSSAQDRMLSELGIIALGKVIAEVCAATFRSGQRGEQDRVRHATQSSRLRQTTASLPASRRSLHSCFVFRVSSDSLPQTFTIPQQSSHRPHRLLQTSDLVFQSFLILSREPPRVDRRRF